MEKILVSVENLVLLAQTDKAYLVQTIEGVEAWIPKSQVDYIDFGDSKESAYGQHVKQINEFTIPEWLAKKANLI